MFALNEIFFIQLKRPSRLGERGCNQYFSFLVRAKDLPLWKTNGYLEHYKGWAQIQAESLAENIKYILRDL